MKKIKFKQLATFSLCCSLLVNSLTGVTAVAETMTIESSPTVESSVKEETVKASTDESMKESTEKSTKESVEGSTVKSTAESTQKSEESEQEEITKETTEERKQTEESSIVSPKQIQPVISNGDYYTAIQTELTNFVGRAQIYQDFFSTLPEGRIAFDITTADAPTLNMTDFNLSAELKSLPGTADSNQVNIASSKLSILKMQNSLVIVVPEQTSLLPTSLARGYLNYLDNIHLTVPKYVQSASISGSIVSLVVNGRVGSAKGPIENPRSQVVLSKLTASSFEIHTDKDVLTNYYDATNTEIGTVPGAFLWEVNRYGNATLANIVFMPKQAPVITVALKKVTENFKDVNGTAIPAPTGFAQGKKTSITSNDYTFKQSGTLPKSYKGTDGKTYVLKGWYKGKTKPSTLRTDVPSYKVTYDGNDDLNVVYEEVKTKAYTLPSKEISFGYVDEKGALINPADFTIEAELGESDATETTILSKIYGTNDASNMLKKLAIPGKSYTIPEGGIKTYGTRYVNHTIPKYYKTMSITPMATYTGDKTKYPVADEVRKSIEAPNNIASTVSGTTAYRLSTNGIVFGTRRLGWGWDVNKTEYAMGIYSGLVGRNYNLAIPDKTIYYYLENRRVTENFVDSTGTKITPPPSFTQGKQTVIDSDNFTYTQEGPLPYIYKVNNKPYVLKGWYKGKDKPAKLNQISTDKRNISYPVSYDDQDDVTVVYDELKLGGNTIQFGFVDEQGKYIPPTSKFNVSTDVGVLKDTTYAKLQTVNSTTKGNYLSLTIPVYDPTGGLGQGQTYYGTLNSIVTIPKYYKTPTLTPSSNYQGTAYPGVTGVWDFHNGTTNVYSPSRLSLTPVSNSQTNYQVQRVWWANEATKTLFSSLYKMNFNNVSETAVGLAEYYATGTVNYYLENRRVTENFVDASGAKLPSVPTGFTQGKQTAIDSDAYTFKQSGTLPESYKGTDGKTYIFKGWYKGKTKPDKLETSKTPSYAVTYDDNDDLNVVYEEGVPTVEASLKGVVTIMPSGGNQIWNMAIKNTGTAPLTSLKVAPTAKWSKGLAIPKELQVRVTGSASFQAIPVTTDSWTKGVALGVDIPVGQAATVMFSTIGTGASMEVLEAEVNLISNVPAITVSDTVRIQGSDQVITDPVDEGFISVPTFDFGQVGIAGATTQHGLKKAADYYGNGTRNPFVRIKKSQPNWSLTAQLSQPKSAKDSLPTATRLLLGQAAVSKVDNYNLVTEMMNPVGTTPALSLTANNVVTNVITNKQFAGDDVYHLDFAFNNIKLEVPANQGTKGEQYNATVTWNLVTGP